MRPRLQISFLALPLSFALALGLAESRSTAQSAPPQQLVTPSQTAPSQAAPAQAAPAQAAENPGLTANANSVTLDVFVGDKLGHPVHGLTQQDFTVLDNGQPAQLTGFRAVDASTNPNASSVLVVVDMINNNIVSVEREREQVNQFLLQDGGKLGHPVSIAAMTETGVKMMHGYSQDGHALSEAFKQLQSQIRAVGRSAGFYGAAERLQESLTALTQISFYLSKQPGRKLVIVIGPGWPMLPGAGTQEGEKQRDWVFNTLVQITNTLRESHVALYSVNPFFLGASDPFYYQAYRKPVKQADKAEFPYLALQVFAEHSGGLALESGNDVVGSINTILRDAGAYYQLTFSGAPADRINELHTLQVKTTKPDATTRTNSFYYARPTPLGNGKTVPPNRATNPR